MGIVTCSIFALPAAAVHIAADSYVSRYPAKLNYMTAFLLLLHYELYLLLRILLHFSIAVITLRWLV